MAKRSGTGAAIRRATRGVVATVEQPNIEVGDWVLIQAGSTNRVAAVTNGWLRSRNRHTPNWRLRVVEIRKADGTRWTRLE